MNIRQLLYNRLVHLAGKEGRANWERQLLQTAYLKLLAAENPLVSTKIGQLEIHVPFAETLPHFVATSTLFSDFLSRVHQQLITYFGETSAVIAGAETGILLPFLPEKLPTLAIEGNQTYFDTISKQFSSLPNLRFEPARITNEEIDEFMDVPLGTVVSMPFNWILQASPDFLHTKWLIVSNPDVLLPVLESGFSWLKQETPLLQIRLIPNRLYYSDTEIKDIFTLIRDIGYWSLTGFSIFGKKIHTCTVTDQTGIQNLLKYAKSASEGMIWLILLPGKEKELHQALL
ncbi:MAG: hypothetical protein LC115_04300 [Bacteroidia bacterium]|nr:hypothetical protein [Bacteroidia bacterium]